MKKQEISSSDKYIIKVYSVTDDEPDVMVEKIKTIGVETKNETNVLFEE